MATKTASKTTAKPKSKAAPKAKAKPKAAPRAKAKAKAAPKVKKATNWKSRAAIRLVEPGSSVDCELCGERVKFQARMRHQQVICNIYTKGVWERVDHYHAPCYNDAGKPFGKPTEKG